MTLKSFMRLITVCDSLSITEEHLSMMYIVRMQRARKPLKPCRLGRVNTIDIVGNIHIHDPVHSVT